MPKAHSLTEGDSRAQVGFTTFGPVHLLQLLLPLPGPRTGADPGRRFTP
ncbi:hypothetical protein D187_009201 [Cystobacter fuscus DSM 2262]|uniref:Uncharacterized protein n=1 Tax=Cystobacter fuscus (strain ATCC 25194 / DSM 2262 / NBRC 100088 / M29) TaxID=1242864 RepID=S9NTX7_CYSF2|nr:hypothetical protein [Cystobacter fuscus]EPX55590.1 hypothetical protein D187_009201 [Cystobacter fuscus DSM 2262]